MDFSGQVWFDFGEPAVWHFYRFVRALAASGAAVSLEWSPLPTPGQEDAMSVFEGLSSAEDRGRFLHAMLGLVHIDGSAASDPSTARAAATVAGVEWMPVSASALHSLSEEASGLGVRYVPSLYRHGPVVAITLNGAAASGDVAATAAAISAVLANDGIWELRKP